ncbi:TauD/TfdA family dioxygenase [Sneathiella sp. CAU 1612]|uniref:TauD/TfdA family dioxygenase n=1 Tax=Sneathiella sedimenti TaxID=2816034 RepID=A0ABS3F543_9PROT|nr:TauD/TfdA family dioxygenase [Sneathiella sedimenti]MBO0333648.1 TauD/TfdA family dioxygenase [Sneathiella sedimenti]
MGQTLQSATGFSVEPLDKSFGALVREIDLRDLDSATFDDLYQAWLTYGLLIFPGQNLTKREQVTFARRFGDLVEELKAVEISNVKPDGSLRDAPGDDMMKIIRGNMHWHQDSTYMPVQAKGAVFSAHVVPKRQGDTAFADMRDAYDALDDATKAQINSLSAYHSLEYSQRAVGEETKKEDSEYFGYGMNVADVPLRPLVKTHPETGRKALAVGRHAYGIPGLSEADSEELIARLNNFAVADERRIYQHRWTAGDVVLWDNRCLMHKACAWDFSEPRIMLHSRIAGDPASEQALAAQ